MEHADNDDRPYIAKVQRLSGQGTLLFIVFHIVLFLVLFAQQYFNNYNCFVIVHHHLCTDAKTEGIPKDSD